MHNLHNFLLQYNLSEFTSRQNKFKRWFFTLKKGLKKVFKISEILIYKIKSAFLQILDLKSSLARKKISKTFSRKSKEKVISSFLLNNLIDIS